MTGAAPAPAGTIALESAIARQTAGALGEPFRAIALLPGVTTSVAASIAGAARFGTLAGDQHEDRPARVLPVTPEVTGYTAEAISPNSPRRHVVADTLFLPLPLIGLEVVL